MITRFKKKLANMDRDNKKKRRLKEKEGA